jgi:hypothetical protein
MCKSRLGNLLVVLLLAVAIPSATVSAQSFGGTFQRKKIVLVRKLPPAGHIDGSSFTVKVTGVNVPGDVTAVLESTIESIIVANDPRLRSVTPQEKPDAVVNVQVIGFSQPPPQNTQSAGMSFNKKPAPPVTTSHVTGLMKANFNAQDVKRGHSIAANTVTIKYDQEFILPQPATTTSKVPSFGSIISAAHIPTRAPSATDKSGPSDEADQPPTPVELRDWLVQNTAMGIASLLVNTTEQVQVNLAVGGGLDDADRLMDQKLWTRALEGLETMNPFPSPDQDAYRLYDLGVVNEALGYSAEDVTKASKYLQEASIDYGKAIDAKPAEKNFLQPQTRIDTALAHYKTLGEQATRTEQMQTAAAAPAADALTNADVISMVAAKLDEANILDTIKTATAVNFDLSAHGQIELAKGNVNGRIIAAMKAKTRGQ